MANKARGEVELNAGGRVFRLRLTLGALAEIEDGFALDDLSQVEERLRKLRAADLAIVAAALIRGGGAEMTPAEALRLPVELPELVRAVTAAFGANGEGGAGEGPAVPFPGRAGSSSVSA
jgi:hypothetical protein